MLTKYFLLTKYSQSIVTTPVATYSHDYISTFTAEETSRSFEYDAINKKTQNCKLRTHMTDPFSYIHIFLIW